MEPLLLVFHQISHPLSVNMGYKPKVSGNLKGKTPIEVLLSDPGNGKKSLNDQYIWLKSNLEKYPKNRELMEAIEDAASQDQCRVIKKREKSFGTFFFCHKTKNGQIYDIIPYT